jgi:hypothetical protein
MEDPITKGKKLYKSIGNVSSPSLNDDVAFNSMGFRHLIRKHGVRRPKSEQKRRFNLLVFAREVIKNPDEIIHSEPKKVVKLVYRHGKRKSIETSAKFWKMKKKFPDKTITVVIRQFQGGKKHFLSIY